MDVIDCELIPFDNGYKCKLCGWTTKIQNVHRHCPQKPMIHIPVLETPSIAQRMKNFGVAATQHALKGSPKASQEQINDRLSICKTCPLFRMYTEEPVTGLCTHTSCGCNISDQQRYMNKLAWADQTCPLINEEFPQGKWHEIDQKYKTQDL